MSSSGLHGQKREHQTEEQKRIKFEAEKEQIKEYNDLDLLLLQNVLCFNGREKTEFIPMKR